MTTELPGKGVSPSGNAARANPSPPQPRTKLVKVTLCQWRRDWPWVEVAEIIRAVVDAEGAELDSFLLFAALRDYAPVVHLHGDGTADVQLHKRCCGMEPTIFRAAREWQFARGESVFDDQPESAGDDATTATD